MLLIFKFKIALEVKKIPICRLYIYEKSSSNNRDSYLNSPHFAPFITLRLGEQPFYHCVLLKVIYFVSLFSVLIVLCLLALLLIEGFATSSSVCTCPVSLHCKLKQLFFFHFKYLIKTSCR